MRLFKLLVKQPRLWLLHISLIVIAVGALVTAFSAKETTLVLRADHPVKRYGHTVELAAMDTLIVDGSSHFIAVNHPITVGECRLYQQSYLAGEISVVSMRKDRLGTAITFLGYFLFVASGLTLGAEAPRLRNLAAGLRRKRGGEGASAPSVFAPSVFIPIIALSALTILSILLAESPLLRHAHWAAMALVAAFIAAISLRDKSIRLYGLLAAACFAAVAAMQALRTPAGAVMPALQSPWLALHVGIVMLSYALFIVIAIKALRRQTPQRLLGMAVWLLGVGIITGSVWANEAWGRYWSWDPKETLALVTFLLYAVPLHLRRPRPWHYIAPLPALLLTWFGISLFHSLHTYG